MPTHPYIVADLICDMRNLLVNNIPLATYFVVIFEHHIIPGCKIANKRPFCFDFHLYFVSFQCHEKDKISKRLVVRPTGNRAYC